MKWIPLLAACVLSFSSSTQADDMLVRLGSTTSVKSSGLLDALKPAFEHDTAYQLHTEATGDGKAMQLARDGSFDVLIVNALAAEQEMIDQGFAEQRMPFMRSYFLLVGPAADPAHVQCLTNAPEALRRIAASQSLFISRADDSGTHQKELSLWRSAHVEPIGTWYFKSGQSMGAVLALARARPHRSPGRPRPARRPLIQSVSGPIAA